MKLLKLWVVALALAAGCGGGSLPRPGAEGMSAGAARGRTTVGASTPERDAGAKTTLDARKAEASASDAASAADASAGPDAPASTPDASAPIADAPQRRPDASSLPEVGPVGAPCGPMVPPGGGGGRGGMGGSPFPAPDGDGPSWFLQPCAVVFSSLTVGFFDPPPAGIAVGTSVASAVTIANTSKKTPLTITSATIEGANATDFAVDPDSLARAMAVPLSPNESQNGRGEVEVQVIFTATADGTRTGILRLESSAGTAQVTLIGRGLPTRPVAALGPPPVQIAFPAQVASTAPGKVVVENAGGAPLVIESMTFGGADPDAFRRTAVNRGLGNCAVTGPQSLDPLGSCAIGIEVVPGTLGPKSASYVLQTNDPVTPTITIPLTLAP
jgi:hypothetical protein